jgi:DMSO reductase anchor subunit
MLATALAAVRGEPNVAILGQWAMLLTVAGMATRIVSLRRNAALKPKSTLQSAIGIQHPKVVQKAQGFMGGSFNTREFFHGRGPGTLRMVKWLFIAAAFVLPVVLVKSGLGAGSSALLVLAFAVQFCGLVAERWFFFAQANHPQNLYYQTVS